MKPVERPTAALFADGGYRRQRDPGYAPLFRCLDLGILMRWSGDAKAGADANKAAFAIQTDCALIVVPCDSEIAALVLAQACSRTKKRLLQRAVNPNIFGARN